jgi:hypothetical protein
MSQSTDGGVLVTAAGCVDAVGCFNIGRDRERGNGESGVCVNSIILLMRMRAGVRQ